MNLLVPLAVIMVSRRLGANFFLFAASMAYVPYLVAGQIFYLGLYRRTIGPAVLIVVLPAYFAIILYGIVSIHTSFLPIKNSYLISLVHACGIFCIFFKLDRALAHGPAIRFLATSGFAVYLVHGVIGHRSSRLCGPSRAQDQPSWRPRGVMATCAAFVHLMLKKPLLAAGYRLAGRLRPEPSGRRIDRGDLAHPERLELPTPRFVVWCSIQLSYGCRRGRGISSHA